MTNRPIARRKLSQGTRHRRARAADPAGLALTLRRLARPSVALLLLVLAPPAAQLALAQAPAQPPAPAPAAGQAAGPSAAAPQAPRPAAPTAPDAAPAVDSALQIESLKAQLLANPYNAKLHTELGILYARENLLEEARGEFIAAIQAAPVEPSAHLNLGLCLMRMERYDEAVTPFAAFAKLSPSTFQGYDLLGQAQAKSGDMEAARATWKSGVSNPNLAGEDRARLIQRLAQIHIDQSKWDEAIATLRQDQALVTAPAGAPIRESLGFVYLTQAKAAREADDDEQTMRLYALAREVGTTNPAAYLVPADMLLAQGKLEEAEQLVQQAEPTIAQEPTLPLLKARIAEQRGDLQAAIHNLRLALRRNPAQTGVYPKLGELLALQGDETGATQALAKASERGEGGPAVRYNLGVVLTQRERFTAAIPHLQAAIAGDSTMQDAYRALGGAFRRLDRQKDAAAVYQQLVDRFGPDPRDVAPLALCLAGSKQHKQAVEAYKLLTAAEPENHAAFYNLGLSLAELSRYGEAGEAFSAALALDPTNEAYQFNLASAFQKQGMYEEAIAAYEKALEMQVTYRSYVNIAICYDKIGFQESRDKYYKLATELKNKKKG